MHMFTYKKSTPERLLVCSGVHSASLTQGRQFANSGGVALIVPCAAIRRKRDCYSVAIYAWRGA